MMLGLAVGDALGVPTEGLMPEIRRATCGEIRDYLTVPSPFASRGEALGVPSDDTQLAFWTLEQINRDRGFVPQHVANRFCQNRIFGIGATVRGFLQNHREGKPWYACGPKSAGNGALMRIAPMLIPHLRRPSPALWIDTALSAMITHNDSASISACLAYVSLLWELLNMTEPPQPQWWLEHYVQTAADLEIDETYRPRRRPLIGSGPDYQGPIWRFVRDQVGLAYKERRPVVEACNSWHSGAYLLETIPCVLYILMLHGSDPEQAIVRAVNDTVDNDTIAAIVGAAVGALHGKGRLPARWLGGLSGRTRERDDGRVFELLQEAEKLWWQKESD
jgi:ADP-ribosylglycohydrolase